MEVVKREESKIKERESLKDGNSSEIIQLMVGGNHQLTTTLQVLCQDPASKLAWQFTEGKKDLKILNGHHFLDRDGKTFEALLNYLRNDRQQIPKFETKTEDDLFHNEVKFWGIGLRESNTSSLMEYKYLLSERSSNLRQSTTAETREGIR